MRFQYLLLASIVTASPALAKDVTITLNDQEQQAFVQIMDSATRAGGLAATGNTVYFYNKLQNAIAAANAPTTKLAEPPKADEPKQADRPAGQP